jgi:O-acetyl-ADP-ribose deacetylase (regulator of RNase III)
MQTKLNVNGVSIELVEGDITNLALDAIVNLISSSARAWLGPSIERAAQRSRPNATKSGTAT